MSAIVINGNNLRTREAEWSEREGIQSERVLAIITVPVTTYGPDDEAIVRGWITANSVEVQDPMLKRTYQASVRLVSEASSENRPEIHFRLDVEELDAPRKFDAIVIADRTYKVLGHRNMTLGEGKGLMWRVLLQLSPAELAELQEKKLALHETQSPTEAQRIGVDAEAAPRVIGGWEPWSRHGEGAEEFYKQTITLFPADHQFDTSLNHTCANAIHVTNLVKELALTNERLAILAEVLATTGQIDESVARRLATVEPVAQSERRRFSWQLSRVDDAADDLKD